MACGREREKEGERGRERERKVGVVGREWEKEGGGEGVAVTINMHQSDGSMRYLTMQANPNSAMPLRKGRWGEGGSGGEAGVGVGGSQSAWVHPLNLLLTPPTPTLGLQSHPSVSMEETSLFLLTCFS